MVGSFGKTFHVTGWKSRLLRRYTCADATVPSGLSVCQLLRSDPVQLALANYMQQHPEHIQNLAGFYQAKRDRFIEGLTGSRFQWLPSQGTYFQNVDYSHIRPDLNDVEFCRFLAEQHGIVGIPVSVFYQQVPEALRMIRFALPRPIKPWLRQLKFCKAYKFFQLCLCTRQASLTEIHPLFNTELC